MSDFVPKDASRTPALLGLDAKAFVLIFPSIFYVTVWTVVWDVLVIAFFVYLRSKRLEAGVAYRQVRGAARGRVITSRPWWFSKKWRVK